MRPLFAVIYVLSTGEGGVGRGLCAAHDCRFALGQVFADEGGGQAHVDLKISSGNSSGTKVVGARKACCHNLLNKDSKWEIFHGITTASDAGATAECQNTESASLARRSNCLEAEAVVEASFAGEIDVMTSDGHGSCMGGDGGVSKT